MARAHGLCGRCSGPIRGRSARRAHAVADCANCRTPLCSSHAGFDADNDRYLCGKCARTLQITVTTSRG